VHDRQPNTKRLFFACLTMVLGATSSAACNQVVGIAEPIELPEADSGFERDGSRILDVRGPTVRGGSGSEVEPVGDASPDASPPSDTPPGVDASPRPDGSQIADASATDRAVATDTGARRDVVDGAIILDAGAAIGSCSWSDLSDTNADPAVLLSNLGNARRVVDGVGDAVDVTLTSFVRGVSRSVRIHLESPIVPGSSIVLDDSNHVEYYEVATSRRWKSALAQPRGGSVRIDAVNGATFAFALVKAKMGPENARGSFTLDGSGSANPQ
jgi:hypothetical protein